MLFPAIQVRAATITVSGDCSLAEAIQNATDNAQTNSDCAAGDGDDMIRLTSDITLTGNVTLAGNDRLEVRTSLTINGNGHTLSGPKSLLDVRGATQNSTLTLTINRLTLTNNNSPSSDNEALRLWDGASLVVNNSIFKNISANDDDGAAIQVRSNGRNVTINNSTFSGNFAKFSGGVISSELPGTTITISNSTFSDNASDANGGAIAVSAGVTLNISGSTFSGNEAASSGGAIQTSDQNTNLIISNSVFSYNSAGHTGGAISGNSSALNIFRSSFSGNAADEAGGAVFFAGIDFRLENSTFYDNAAADSGGALWLDDFWLSATADIRHVTFVNNRSTDSGKNGNSIYADATVTVNMRNSIIEETLAANGESYDGTDCAGLLANENSNNIIEDGSCSTSSALSRDPLLGGRAGSPAYYTLRPNSPAIDAADTPASIDACNELRTVDGQRFDQRGVARPVGEYCDFGAFEYIPPPPGSGGGGGRGGRGGSRGLAATPIPTSMPGCVHCPDLLARGFRLNATYGLGSGVQFQRLDRRGIGLQSVLDAGFMDAVDVWGYAEQGVEVCFPAAGSLILLDATTSPRAPASPQTYSQDGMTCAAIDRPGTLVLVSNPPSGLPVLPSIAEFAAPAATQAPPGYQPLWSCMVTTQNLMRFRAAPGGALLQYTDPWGRQENGWLPGSVTLTALERTPDWFKVDYHGTRGWVSAHHVTPHGACG